MDKIKPAVKKVRAVLQARWRDLKVFLDESWSEITRTEDPQELQLVDFLRNVKLFEGLKKNTEFLSLIKFLHRRQYSKDEVIFSEGDPASALYIVEQGQVALQGDAADSFKEKLLEEGDFFGELAVCLEHKRTAEARARSAVTIYLLFRKNFQRFVQRYPQSGLQILLNLNRQLATDLRKTELEMSRLSSQTDQTKEPADSV